MTDSKDKIEINSASFSQDNAANLLSSMHDANHNAEQIAKLIIHLKEKLKNLQVENEDSKTKEEEICNLKNKLKEMVEEYKTTINYVLKLAKMVNYDVNNLNIDINGTRKIICQTDDTSIITDCNEKMLTPVVILENDSNKPNIFLDNCETKCNKTLFQNNCNESICSCDYKPKKCVIKNKKVKKKVIKKCDNSKKVKIDCEKEKIKNNLMTMKGELKILNQQNQDLLYQLNSGNQQIVNLSNVLHNKPICVNNQKECNADTEFHENTDMKSEVQFLTCENKRLNEELQEIKRDMCQIELARKVLNISDSQCANCVGLTNPDRVKPNEQTDDYNQLAADRDAKTKEIINLRRMLDEAKHRYKSCEECLLISKTQVTQLEKQLFDLCSTKIYDSQLIHSDEKYLIENLRHCLKEKTEETTNMQMVLDFHQTELEDKKSKYLAVLQKNQEQKHRIESLCKEKNTIACEYEAEFKRMNDHLEKCLEENAKLPGMLASVQRDLDIERTTRINLQSERGILLNEVESLRSSLENADNEKYKKMYEELEGINTELRAEIRTLHDTLKENKRLYFERAHYALQLKENLNAVREEAAVQVTKVKDFSECQKLKYTEYIQKLEEQLAESRAVACCEFKKRDIVDERLRNQIITLTATLDGAHKKIEELYNAKHLMEFNENKELCKIPRVIKSKCKDLNSLKDSDEPINE